MSPLGRLMALWPLIHVSLVSLATWVNPLAGVAVLYLLPPLLHRVHQRFFPIREGMSRLVGPGYVPWWGSHQLQVLYIALPWLEGLLRVCGLYSPWLRLWGAKVGRRVYWTPRVDLADRSLLEVGDDVVFGHRVSIFAHVIVPTRRRGAAPGPAPGGGENLSLYVRRVRIGDRAFIGAGTGMGPGVQVGEGAYVPLQSELYPNSRVGLGRPAPPRRPLPPRADLDPPSEPAPTPVVEDGADDGPTPPERP